MITTELRSDGNSRRLVLTPGNAIDKQLLQLFAINAKSARISSGGERQEVLIFEAIDQEEAGEGSRS
jgi:hypothetical protein